jgi:DNA-binding transcriptional MerR regulator
MHPNLPDKRYYGIGEVSKAFGVNPSLIRFWEKEFTILNPKKNTKGNRKFTPEDIKHLQRIYHLVKERGFTLEGAKQQLKNKANSEMSNNDLIMKLENIKRELIAIKENL